MNPIILGNLIALAGSLFMVGVGFVKQRKNILLVQSVQFGLMGLGNFILGGMAGFISNMLGIVRNLFCLKHELPVWAGCIFVAVQAALTFSVNGQGAIGWLPTLAALVFTLSINTKNEVRLKCAIIFGQLCWVIYDLAIRNYTGFIFDLVTTGSNVVGIVLLKKNAARAAEKEKLSQ